MSESTITSKGRITIPADIRKSLGLTPGDRVAITKLEDGTTVIRVKRWSILELKGLLKDAKDAHRVSIDGMNIGRS